MTREEAIQYWEGLRKTFSSQLEKEENHFGRMHLETTIDVLDTTISALRQQKVESKLKVVESNEPLTLDELRKMYDGEEGAVWVKNGRACFPAILDIYDGELVAVWSAEPDYFEERHYGKNWLAYRQKPEEETV